MGSMKTPLDILIPENCATNRKIRVRLSRMVSSGHFIERVYTRVDVYVCADAIPQLNAYVCISAKYSRRQYMEDKKGDKTRQRR